jgi:hypothetical protein
MKLKLESRWVQRLVATPESGMGYHRVRVTLRSGRVIERALVHNAEILEIADPVETFEQSDIVEIEARGAGRH